MVFHKTKSAIKEEIGCYAEKNCVERMVVVQEME